MFLPIAPASPASQLIMVVQGWHFCPQLPLYSGSWSHGNFWSSADDGHIPCLLFVNLTYFSPTFLRSQLLTSSWVWQISFPPSCPFLLLPSLHTFLLYFCMDKIMPVPQTSSYHPSYHKCHLSFHRANCRMCRSDHSSAKANHSSLACSDIKSEVTVKDSQWWFTSQQWKTFWEYLLNALLML